MSTTISGDTGIDKVQSGTVINASSIMGALNASGTAPIYACRAWVNFNGTGTVEIRASGNVSSITDNGNGDYTVNFTTAMADANYNWIGSGQQTGSSCLICGHGTAFTQSTTALQRVVSLNYSMASVDATYINISVFR